MSRSALIDALVPIGTAIRNGHGIGGYDELLYAIAAAKNAARELRHAPAIPRDFAAEILSFMELMAFRDVPPGALVRPKAPLEYQKKLNFHRSIKNASEYGLSA